MSQLLSTIVSSAISGGEVIAANDTTSTTLYPIFVGGVGDRQTPKTTTGRITWNASTGALTVTGTILIDTSTNTNSSKLVAAGTISETVSGTQYLVASQYDIGTDPGEIPINQYLGTLAYQDSVSVRVGQLLASGAGGIGYTLGAGSAVTQTSSRTSAVEINSICGAITLVSAAGSTSWQSFTVTNNTVAATDTVIVNQKSGTDLYLVHVTAVAAGSFRLTFATTAGTTTEQPVFNFAVLKASIV
jgi:hypothetical protein